MAVEKPDSGTIPKDLTKVSITTRKDLDYWTYRLHCTEAELKDAVESVGNETEKIREYLHMVRGERDEE